MRFSYVYKTGLGRLEENVWSVSCTKETEITIWNLEFECFVGKLFTSLSPCKKISINSALDIFLSFLIIRIFSSPSHNILGNNTTFWVELYIFSFLLTDKDRFIESEMNCSNDLFFTWLEKCKFYVGKRYIYNFSFYCTVSEAVQVTF